MGMASSQARLLAITARIHDVEYQAQSIQNAKIQLATKEDQVYQEYMDALDATTLTVTTLNSDGTRSKVPANFNTLCSRNRVTSASGYNYSIVDNKGRLIVEDEMFEGYEKFKDSNIDKSPYHFALFMMGYDSINDYEKLVKTEESVYQKHLSDENVTKSVQEYHEVLERLFEKEGLDSDDIADRNALKDNKEALAQYDKAYASYQRALYQCYGEEEIYPELNEGKELNNSESSLFQYYISEYKKIEAYNGNIVPISDYNGTFNGNAATNTDWLQAMVQAGKFTIEVAKEDTKTHELDISAASVSSDIGLEYTITTEIDSRAAAVAEAKYEHEMKQIDRKDKKFDTDLSKLETERTALKTEYDSIKKVIEDNIERTFGIFS